MKNSAEYAVLLKKLCNKLKRGGKAPIAISLTEPTTALVLACLSEATIESKAQASLNKLESIFVDHNELRVARLDEIIDILGKGFPQCRAVASQIISLLQQIYDAQDNLSLSNLLESGKRDAKSFLEKLNGITPYIVSRTMLQGVGAHAFPVHGQLLEALRQEGVVHPDADAAEVQGFLERQIPASQIQKTYAMLRYFADTSKSKHTATADKTEMEAELEPESKTVQKAKKPAKTTTTTTRKTRKTTKNKKD
jgi:endonuclease III